MTIVVIPSLRSLTSESQNDRAGVHLPASYGTGAVRAFAQFPFRHDLRPRARAFIPRAAVTDTHLFLAEYTKLGFMADPCEITSGRRAPKAVRVAVCPGQEVGGRRGGGAGGDCSATAPARCTS
ncbi:hypothetical protein EVAR_493_1 [Eumeta japonica]|uniref:Uncharacterized protein n=1 Tax=Eumeta variegata TaxID=151549 RepID=A0A4C1SBH2_EUMVA|nr:hypothetical protein EVAR_493_1 [Eumeta japonica]